MLLSSAARGKKIPFLQQSLCSPLRLCSGFPPPFPKLLFSHLQLTVPPTCPSHPPSTQQTSHDTRLSNALTTQRHPLISELLKAKTWVLFIILFPKPALCQHTEAAYLMLKSQNGTCFQKTSAAVPVSLFLLGPSQSGWVAPIPASHQSLG